MIEMCESKIKIINNRYVDNVDQCLIDLENKVNEFIKDKIVTKIDFKIDTDICIFIAIIEYLPDDEDEDKSVINDVLEKDLIKAHSLGMGFSRNNKKKEWQKDNVFQKLINKYLEKNESFEICELINQWMLGFDAPQPFKTNTQGGI